MFEANDTRCFWDQNGALVYVLLSYGEKIGVEMGETPAFVEQASSIYPRKYNVYLPPGFEERNQW